MTASPQRRAERLLRCYPASWRDRYGEEFAALLEADIADRPADPRRALDIARAGLVARWNAAGIGAGPPLDPTGARATVVVASTIFCAAALSLWTQLMGGAASVGADTIAVPIGLIGTSATLLLLLIAGARYGGSVARCLLAGNAAGASRRALSVLLVCVGGSWPGSPPCGRPARG